MRNFHPHLQQYAQWCAESNHFGANTFRAAIDCLSLTRSSVPASAVGKGLADNGGFTPAELRAIDRDNALELLPRLKV